MSFQSITHKLLLSCKDEINKPDNMEIIKKDIIHPVVEIVIEELYPYFAWVSFIIALVIFMIVIILVLNVRICYR